MLVRASDMQLLGMNYLINAEATSLLWMDFFRNQSFEWPIHYKKNDLLRRTYCGGCETSRYMSPIAARFGPAAEHGSIAAG